MGAVGEQKTKPTQQSVRELRSVGIQPSVIIARGERSLEPEIEQKIAFFCDIPVEGVISAPDAPTIYDVPILFQDQGLTEYILERLHLKPTAEDLTEWKAFLDRLKNPHGEVTIALVGKYTHLKDSYISHIEAFHHASAATRVQVNLRWVESMDIEKKGAKILEGADGILVPGGFGDRGIEGKIAATRYAADNDIPFQGVCLGFQLATVGFAREVLGLKEANSFEFNPKTPHPVVDLLPEQRGVKDLGATMRLGAHEILLQENSKTAKLYESAKIFERHRHRYEINPDYLENLEAAGLKYVGRSDGGRRMEVLELKGHRYFIASQFHPELRSRPLRPSPIHTGLVRAAAS
jgi:CTP synthase